MELTRPFNQNVIPLAVDHQALRWDWGRSTIYASLSTLTEKRSKQYIMLYNESEQSDILCRSHSGISNLVVIDYQANRHPETITSWLSGAAHSFKAGE